MGRAFLLLRPIKTSGRLERMNVSVAFCFLYATKLTAAKLRREREGWACGTRVAGESTA